MFLYRNTTRTRWQPGDSNRSLQKDTSQVSCAYWWNLSQTELSVLFASLPSPAPSCLRMIAISLNGTEIVWKQAASCLLDHLVIESGRPQFNH